MTVADFLNAFDQQTELPVFYFTAVPLSAFLALWLHQGRATQSPWKYFFTGLVYLTIIPGVFALLTNVYLLVFGSGDVLGFNIYTQILPVVSMLLTLWLIRKSISFDLIPGFDKVIGFMGIVGVVFIILFILDRSHILFITRVPFQYGLLFMLGLILLGVWMWKRYIKSSSSR
jgi:hypothetical protein